MINLYTGFDVREEAGTHVFNSSVIQHATEPVSITHLALPHMRRFYGGGQRDGTNAFIYSRFLIPYIQRWSGMAIFADGADMLCRADIAELWSLRDPFCAVQVVKHQYQTRRHAKYIGTQMESVNTDYPRKNWSSLMIINCAHYAWRNITPEAVESMSGSELHGFQFINDRFIGALPVVWNCLDEYGEILDAKIVHWTLGTPAFEHYKDAPHAGEFRAQLAKVNHVIS
jgi:hypothetical protein